MTAGEVVLRGARIFDGCDLRDGLEMVLNGDRIAAIRADTGTGRDLGGGILAPGLIDLQVNGGGGIMLDGRADVAGIAAICAAHARLDQSRVAAVAGGEERLDIVLRQDPAAYLG